MSIVYPPTSSIKRCFKKSSLFSRGNSNLIGLILNKTSNSSLANATSSNGQIIKQGDGSYQVYGVRKTGKYDFSARMNVNTSDTDTAQWWKNIEMTGYTKVLSASSIDAALDWVCKRSYAY